MKVLSIASSIGQSFTRFVARRRTFLWVTFLLLLAWAAFLLIVKEPPIDAAPALIMVWVSLAVLLAALFPGAFGRLMRMKFKDLEWELQEAVEKAVEPDIVSVISIPEIDPNHGIEAEKGDLPQLASVLEQASKNVTRSVLAIMNLRRGDVVSVPRLFGYLFFLSLCARDVTILFVSTLREPERLTDIREAQIIGAADGRSALRALINRFPDLGRIFDLTGGEAYPTPAVAQYFRSGRYNADASLDFLERFFSRFDVLDLRQFCLTSEELEEVLEDDLTSDMWSLSRHDFSTDVLRAALRRGDQFAFVSDGDRPVAVVRLSDLSTEILKQMLRAN